MTHPFSTKYFLEDLIENTHPTRHSASTGLLIPPWGAGKGIATLALDSFPLTANEVAKATREDPVYGRLLTAVKTGNLNRQDKSLSTFLSVFNSLSIQAGCIIFGSRVVIPTRQQARLLFELHHTHMGIVKMKSLAREYMWWPSLNKDIESIAASCKACAKYKKAPPSAPLTHWPWACSPMERIHVDFADYKGIQLLIVIDAYTKYIWTYIMGKDTTTSKLLRQLDHIFADRGLPMTIVSDNGPQFTSDVCSKHENEGHQARPHTPLPPCIKWNCRSCSGYCQK